MWGASPDLGINPPQYWDQILGLMTLAQTKSVKLDEDPILGLMTPTQTKSEKHTCPMRSPH